MPSLCHSSASHRITGIYTLECSHATEVVHSPEVLDDARQFDMNSWHGGISVSGMTGRTRASCGHVNAIMHYLSEATNRLQILSYVFVRQIKVRTLVHHL